MGNRTRLWFEIEFMHVRERTPQATLVLRARCEVAQVPTEPLGARGLVVVRHFSGSRPRFGVPVPARAPIGGRRDFNEVLCTASSSSVVRVPTRRSAVPARRGRRALLWRSSARSGVCRLGGVRAAHSILRLVAFGGGILERRILARRCKEKLSLYYAAR